RNSRKRIAQRSDCTALTERVKQQDCTEDDEQNVEHRHHAMDRSRGDHACVRSPGPVGNSDGCEVGQRHGVLRRPTQADQEYQDGDYRYGSQQNKNRLHYIVPVPRVLPAVLNWSINMRTSAMSSTDFSDGTSSYALFFLNHTGAKSTQSIKRCI